MIKRGWFVGATILGKDQTDTFINDSIWVNKAESAKEKVKTIQVNDKIALKSTYTRKHNVPFENNGQVVSVMAIKAIGTVTHNYGDGERLDVEWKRCDPMKEWYFFTNRTTLWEVNGETGSWMHENLLAFTFANEVQQIERFLQHPYWKDRYRPDEQDTYVWTKFYEEFANKLLVYENKRKELVHFLHSMYDAFGMNNPLLDILADGTRAPLQDVCPFTVFGLFNKGMTDENRRKIAAEIAEFLQVEAQVPTSFQAIPILNNMTAWFFGSEPYRKAGDIDRLWELFRIAIRYADEEVDEETFIEIYNRVLNQVQVRWNITIGFYWLRPWKFAPLDTNTRRYLTESLEVFPALPKRPLQGEEYVLLLKRLMELFAAESNEVHSFPELSEQAWLQSANEGNRESEAVFEVTETDVVTTEAALRSYDRTNFLEEVFLTADEFTTLSSLLKRKKNIILEGPPGVGKTFAAERLAYAMLGVEDDSKVLSLQFHQSYSYEDFIIGYRPTETGFVLKEGPFYALCERARHDRKNDYFVIIDEINRGNLAKIFGELLMLIEDDKREKEITLTYTNELFSVPENVYIIGTMNTADRSLAMIDYALRRRFSFFFMKPAFHHENFRRLLREQGVTETMIDRIVEKMGDVNKRIRHDLHLGSGFEIGHSFFCHYDETDNWYDDVITYEIAPLLREYWFDELERVEEIVDELLR